MADQFFSGKQGYVNTGSGNYSFSKWKMRMIAPTIKRNNFTSLFQVIAPNAGVFAAEISLEGPYNYGNMPFTSGGIYTWYLGLSVGVQLVVTGQIENLTMDDDVETAPNVSMTINSNYVFTVVIS